MTDTIQSSISSLIGKLKPSMRHSSSHNNLTNLGSAPEGNFRPGSSSPGGVQNNIRMMNGINNTGLKKTGIGGPIG